MRSTLGGGGPSLPGDGRSDAELMAGVEGANGDAFAVLFRRYGRLVRRVAADILHDAGEAEDVTQEVFLEIYRKASLYDSSRGSVRGWLLQYAYHRALRRKLALSRRVAYDSLPLDRLSVPPASARRLTRDECRWVIRAGLRQLPERQRATLELACFEQLPLRDVADRLGVSIGCTRHYYYRGLAHLRAWARSLMSQARLPHGTRVDSRGARRQTQPVSFREPIKLVPGQAE